MVVVLRDLFKNSAPAGVLAGESVHKEALDRVRGVYRALRTRRTASHAGRSRDGQNWPRLPGTAGSVHVARLSEESTQRRLSSMVVSIDSEVAKTPQHSTPGPGVCRHSKTASHASPAI